MSKSPPAGHEYYPLFLAVRQSKGDFCNRRSQNNCSSGRSTYNKPVRLYAGSKWRQIHQRQMHTFPPHDRNVPLLKLPTLKLFLHETWLSGETPLGMPLVEARKFNRYSKQILNVNVWPSSDVCAQPMAGGTKKLKISVPVCLSFGELEYFMREALYLQSSHAALHLREPEGIYPLQPSDPLKPHHRELECFVRVPPVCLTTP